MTWDYIDVEIPVGTSAKDLTNAPTKVSTSFTENYPPQSERIDFKWQRQPLLRFRAQASTQGKRLTLPAHGSLVLVLENIHVSEGEGLVLLRIHEMGSRLTSSKAGKQKDCSLTLGVAKQSPKLPRNFRPEEKSLVDSPRVTLKWEGPDNLDYTVHARIPEFDMGARTPWVGGGPGEVVTAAPGGSSSRPPESTCSRAPEAGSGEPSPPRRRT